MRELSGILKVSSIYVATVIGAGFASGREIVQFFSVYNQGGFYGIILAGVLFAILGSIVLAKVYRERIRNYDELIFPMLGWFWGWVVQILVSIFLLCLFCVMVSGGATVLREKTSLSYTVSVAIMACIAFVFLAFDLKGVVVANLVLVPSIVAGILFVGIYIIVTNDASVFSYNIMLSNLTNNWVASTILYVGYNSLMSVVVLCTLLPLISSKNAAIVAGSIGGAVLCTIALLINIILMMFYPSVLSKELPILAVLEKMSNAIAGFYALCLWLAMLLSAVNSGFCFVERFTSKLRINRLFFTAILCIASIPMSAATFSVLISTIYTIFGYVGLFIVIAILVDSLKF